jgi:2-oxoglutarate dehydrogenase E1 component
MSFALDFRMQFGRDVLSIYWDIENTGHNEGDEPRFTQPVLYKLIASMKTTEYLH